MSDDISKKILEIELTIYGRDCEKAYDKIKEHRDWLIDQLKECKAELENLQDLYRAATGMPDKGG